MNKMASKNLAIVFGPNLLSKKGGGGTDAGALLNNMNDAYEVRLL